MQVYLRDENFTVHYWDWRDPNQRRSLFRSDRLGEHHMTTAAVSGNLVANDGWTTVCWYASGNAPTPEQNICNPGTPTGPLQRCPNNITCAANYEGWPSYNDVEIAVGKQDYDRPNYNTYSPEGFRGFMEGFQVVPRCDNSTRGQDLCTNEAIADGKEGLQRLLHNTVS